MRCCSTINFPSFLGGSLLGGTWGASHHTVDIVRDLQILVFKYPFFYITLHIAHLKVSVEGISCRNDSYSLDMRDVAV